MSGCGVVTRMSYFEAFSRICLEVRVLFDIDYMLVDSLNLELIVVEVQDQDHVIIIDFHNDTEQSMKILLISFLLLKKKKNINFDIAVEILIVPISLGE